MKKNILKFSIVFVLLIAIVLVLYFTVFKVDVQALANQSVSEMGKDCFFAKDDLSDVKLYTGQRENPYVLDGVHNDCQAFALLIFRTNEMGVEAPTYIAKINGTSYNGILEQNPYDNTFVADLEIEVPADAQIEVTIAIKDNEYNYTLANINKDWAISFEQAKSIGIEYLMEDIQKNVKGRNLDCEIYVKAITDSKGLLSTYYYYVSMIDKNGNSKGVVIDVQTGEIVQ